MITQTKTPNQQPVGFNCPKCNTFVPVTLKSILQQQAHRCTGCLTDFFLNRENSQAALDIVQKLDDKITAIDGSKKNVR